MAKFLTGNELNSELEKLFENAKEIIILISPFIKLHDRYISALRTKRDAPEIQIIIVFGKNEEDISQSMQEEDFNFFKEFPNIQIRYEKRLHAKYYANENNAIITSMNLHRYSQDNNIEAGIMTKAKNIVGLGDTVDENAWNYFYKVIEQSEIVFEKVPQFENRFLGLTKKYNNSKIEKDKLTDFFGDLRTIPHKTSSNASSHREPYGYCIRTGVKIPFDISKPLSSQAYKIWNEYQDDEYPEKYCHLTGEESYGETCYRKPIMQKNWKKAKELYNV